MKKIILTYLTVFCILLISCETESIDALDSIEQQEEISAKTVFGIVKSKNEFKNLLKTRRDLDQCNTFFGKVQFTTGLPGIPGANSGNMVVKACIDGFGPCATIFNGTVYNNSNFYFGAPNFSFDQYDRFNIKVTPNSGGFSNIVKIKIGPAFQTPFNANYYSQYGAAVGPNYAGFAFENCNN